jgi:hypothetical protein
MTENEIHQQIAAWRKGEDRYYQAVLVEPELYTVGIQLVRAVVNRLSHLTEVEALVEAYHQFQTGDLVAIAEEMDLPRRYFLNYDLAREAAFYLRYQEILEAQAQTDMQAHIAVAQTQGVEWVTLYDNETSRHGQTFFQKLEMHLPDGLGLYTAVELDWEQGRVYVLEPLWLDPATGQPQPGIAPPNPKQEFTTREELAAAVAKLRDKYQVKRKT